jgi:hypothetical protein
MKTTRAPPNDQISRDTAVKRLEVVSAVWSASVEYCKTNYPQKWLLDDVTEESKMATECIDFGFEKAAIAFSSWSDSKGILETIKNHTIFRKGSTDTYQIVPRRLFHFAVLANKNSNSNWWSMVTAKDLTSNNKRVLQAGLTLCGLHEGPVTPHADVQFSSFSMQAMGYSKHKQSVCMQNPLKNKEERKKTKASKKKTAISLATMVLLVAMALKKLCEALHKKQKSDAMSWCNMSMWLCLNLMRVGRGEDIACDRFDCLRTTHAVTENADDEQTALPDIPVIASQLQMDNIDSITPLLQHRKFFHWRTFSKVNSLEEKQKRDSTIKVPLPREAAIVCPIRMFIVLMRVMMEIFEIKVTNPDEDEAGTSRTSTSRLIKTSKVHIVNGNEPLVSSIFVKSVSNVGANKFTTVVYTTQQLGDKTGRLFSAFARDEVVEIQDIMKTAPAPRLYLSRNSLAVEVAAAKEFVSESHRHILKHYFRHADGSRQMMSYAKNSDKLPKDMCGDVEINTRSLYMQDLVNKIVAPRGVRVNKQQSSTHVLVPDNFTPCKMKEWPKLADMIKGCLWFDSTHVKFSEYDYYMSSDVLKAFDVKSNQPRQKQMNINTWMAVHFWNEGITALAQGPHRAPITPAGVTGGIKRKHSQKTTKDIHRRRGEQQDEDETEEQEEVPQQQPQQDDEDVDVGEGDVDVGEGDVGDVGEGEVGDEQPQQDEEDVDVGEDEDEVLVERIMDHEPKHQKRVDLRRLRFLIKWEGDDVPTWKNALQLMKEMEVVPGAVIPGGVVVTDGEHTLHRLIKNYVNDNNIDLAENNALRSFIVKF